MQKGRISAFAQMRGSPKIGIRAGTQELRKSCNLSAHLFQRPTICMRRSYWRFHLTYWRFRSAISILSRFQITQRWRILKTLQISGRGDSVSRQYSEITSRARAGSTASSAGDLREVSANDIEIDTSRFGTRFRVSDLP